MPRPAPYNPARRCVPWWWHWSGLWVGKTRYGLWPQAKEYRQRAKRKKG